MTSNLEYLLSQYLDGTLPPGELAMLEERLAVDPLARKLLAEYRALDNAAKTALPLPAIDWDRLAERISTAVAAAPADAEPVVDVRPAAGVDEEFEFALTRYLDRQTSEEESAAIEARLAGDPAARQLLDEYRGLDILAREAWPVPEVNYDRLHQHISSAVAGVAEQQSGPMKLRRDEAEASGAILFSFKQLLKPARLAMAASILLAVSLAIWFYHRNPSAGPTGASNNPGGSTGTQVADISGPAPEAPAGQSTLEIRLEPSSFAAAGQSNPYTSEAMYARGQVQLRDTKPVKYENAVSPF